MQAANLLHQIWLESQLGWKQNSWSPKCQPRCKYSFPISHAVVVVIIILITKVSALCVCGVNLRVSLCVRCVRRVNGGVSDTLNLNIMRSSLPSSPIYCNLLLNMACTARPISVYCYIGAWDTTHLIHDVATVCMQRAHPYLQLNKYYANLEWLLARTRVFHAVVTTSTAFSTGNSTGNCFRIKWKWMEWRCFFHSLTLWWFPFRRAAVY